MSQTQKCPVCDCSAKIFDVNGTKDQIDCLRCGKFALTDVGNQTLKIMTSQQRTLLSAYVYENQEVELTAALLTELKGSLRVPPVNVRADKLLAFLANRFPVIGQRIPVKIAAFRQTRFSDFAAEFSRSEETDLFRLHLELCPVTYSSLQEVAYLLDQMLLRELAVISYEDQLEGYAITPKGWNYLSATLKNPASAYGFVAMRFLPEMNKPYTHGIEKGVQAAGFHPLRIDRHEHVNRIDDEIIMLLRWARFCVADLTHQNQGVYFEAGFSLGFGIPVIWTSREGERSHFDTRQFNTIFWKDEELPRFAERLQFRIERIVGKGPSNMNFGNSIPFG